MYIRGRLHIINFKITYVKQAKKNVHYWSLSRNRISEWVIQMISPRLLVVDRFHLKIYKLITYLFKLML